MCQLPNLTLEAILKEWHPQEYDPPNTDIREWTLAMESLCDTYGIPDTQRQQCATKFIKGELRTELEKVCGYARGTTVQSLCDFDNLTPVQTRAH